MNTTLYFLARFVWMNIVGLLAWRLAVNGNTALVCIVVIACTALVMALPKPSKRRDPPLKQAAFEPQEYLRETLAEVILLRDGMRPWSTAQQHSQHFFIIYDRIGLYVQPEGEWGVHFPMLPHADLNRVAVSLEAGKKAAIDYAIEVLKAELRNADPLPVDRGKM